MTHLTALQAVLETPKTNAKRPDISSLAVSTSSQPTSPPVARRGRSRTQAAHAFTSPSPEPRSLRNSPQHRLDQCAKSSEDHVTNLRAANKKQQTKSSKQKPANLQQQVTAHQAPEPEILSPIKGAAPGIQDSSGVQDDIRARSDASRPGSAVGSPAEHVLASAIDPVQRKHGLGAAQLSVQRFVSLRTDRIEQKGGWLIVLLSINTGTVCHRSDWNQPADTLYWRA